MKVINKNILKDFTKSNFLREILLSVFFIHLILAHVVFQSYTLCFENDGRVIFENLSEHLCCNYYKANSISTLSLLNQDHDDCEDISLTEQCGEDNSLVAVKIIPQLFTSIFTINIHDELSDIKKIDEKYISLAGTFINQLDSYKTITLLI